MCINALVYYIHITPVMIGAIIWTRNRLQWKFNENTTIFMTLQMAFVWSWPFCLGLNASNIPAFKMTQDIHSPAKEVNDNYWYYDLNYHSMAWCKTAVTPVHWQCSYCSLAPSHRYKLYDNFILNTGNIIIIRNKDIPTWLWLVASTAAIQWEAMLENTCWLTWI